MAVLLPIGGGHVLIEWIILSKHGRTVEFGFGVGGGDRLQADEEDESSVQGEDEDADLLPSTILRHLRKGRCAMF